MSGSTDPKDMLLHMLLKELLGGEAPPDVRARVLKQIEESERDAEIMPLSLAEASQQANMQADLNRQASRRAPVRKSKKSSGLVWPLAIAAMILLGIGVGLIILNSKPELPKQPLVISPVDDPSKEGPDSKAPEPPEPPEIPETPEIPTPDNLAIPTLVYASGDVRINGSKSKLGVLALGDELHTRRGLAVATYTDGSRFRIAPMTKMALSKKPDSRSGQGDKQGSTQALSRQLKMMSGSLSVAVKPGAIQSPFIINTPEAKLSVLGTQFEITIENNRTRLEVDAGMVAFMERKTGKRVQVTAGQFAMCGKGMDLQTGLAKRADMHIESFTLIDADSGLPIPGYDPMPESAVIRYADLPTRQINIRMNVGLEKIGSIRLDMNGPYLRTHTENEKPYTLPPDFLSAQAIDEKPTIGSRWTPAPGTYQLMATPYKRAFEAGRRGESASLKFEVRE